MKKKNIFLQTFLFILWFGNNAFAQTISENLATPETFAEPGAKLLITEANIKNKTADWIEIFYSSPSGKPFNIKGFKFQDDGIFKTVDGDYWIESGGYVLVQFKNQAPDDQSKHVINTTRSGARRRRNKSSFWILTEKSSMHCAGAVPPQRAVRSTIRKNFSKTTDGYPPTRRTVSRAIKSGQTRV